MLSRMSTTHRFFSNATTTNRSAQNVLASFSCLRNFFALQNAGCTSAFVADYPADKIQALERLFRNTHGCAVFIKIQDDMNSPADNIKIRVDEELARFPNDPDENVEDPYAAALACVGNLGRNTRN